ncbi:hypothetical protein HDU98_004111 [Podochytrium sp. JEL0797]|nr:hypothetical protein HDU98_004111 [Podochytrium sp. JEL0797]
MTTINFQQELRVNGIVPTTREPAPLSWVPRTAGSGRVPSTSTAATPSNDQGINYTYVNRGARAGAGHGGARGGYAGGGGNNGRTTHTMMLATHAMPPLHPANNTPQTSAPFPTIPVVQTIPTQRQQQQPQYMPLQAPMMQLHQQIQQQHAPHPSFLYQHQGFPPLAGKVAGGLTFGAPIYNAGMSRYVYIFNFYVMSSSKPSFKLNCDPNSQLTPPPTVKGKEVTVNNVVELEDNQKDLLYD